MGGIERDTGMTALKPLGSFRDGFVLPYEAARVLLHGRDLKRVALLPLVVNLLLYIVFFGGAFYAIHMWDPANVEWTFWDPVGPWLGSVVDTFGTILKWIVLGLPLLVLGYYSFTVVGMVLASPINDLLSERVERHLCAEQGKPEMPWKMALKATLLSILDSLLIVLRQILWSLLTLPFLFIPVVGWMPLFLVTAYFTGLGFMDVGMARNFLRDKHKKAGLAHCRWSVFGLGVAMELLFLIPFMGLLLLPLGVVSGTILYTHLDWEGLLGKAGLRYPDGFTPPKPSAPSRTQATPPRP